MKSLLTGLFVLIALIVSALAVLWSAARMQAPAQDHGDALALMQQPWQPEGRNALESLWLMPYAIASESERARVFQEDLRRMRTLPDIADRRRATQQSSAEQTHPRHAWTTADLGRFCKPREDCLAKVQADADGFRELVARNQAALSQLGQADEAGHLQLQFSGAPDLATPPFQRAYYPATELAVRFADGEQLPALEQTCRHVGRWRTIAANSDTLIGTMIGNAYASQGYARLAADMLARVPVSTALPDACVQAFRPPSDAEAAGLCTAMRGEFRYITSRLDQNVDTLWQEADEQPDARTAWMRFVPRRVAFNAGKTRARIAAQISEVCTAQNLRAQAQDMPLAEPVATPAGAPSLQQRLECVDNLFGCRLADTSRVNTAAYAERMRDAHAHYRMLAALVWIRARADATDDPAAALQRLPAGLSTAAHPLRYVPEQRALETSLLRPEQRAEDGSATLRMPLAGSRVPARPSPVPVTSAMAPEPAEATESSAAPPARAQPSPEATGAPL